MNDFNSYPQADITKINVILYGGPKLEVRDLVGKRFVLIDWKLCPSKHNDYNSKFYVNMDILLDDNKRYFVSTGCKPIVEFYNMNKDNAENVLNHVYTIIRCNNTYMFGF